MARLQVMLDQLIQSNSEMTKKIIKMQEISGIGKITAINLILALPELGHLNKKSVASLAGLAQHLMKVAH